MDYKLDTPPAVDTSIVTIEVHGKSTLIVPTKTGKTFPNLTRAGAGRGKTCRGWTPASRRALRVRLEDHEAEFKAHLCFKFPNGSGQDCRRLKGIQDKLFRWIGLHLDCHYIRKVEFSEYETSLHWHVALNIDPEADQHRKLSAYCSQFDLVATVGTKDPETVARYLEKKRQTENPEWFAKDAFKPWHCTFPKPVVEAVVVDREAALQAGAIHPVFGLCYGGAEKVSASISLNGDISSDQPLSLTRDIEQGTEFFPKAYNPPPPEPPGHPFENEWYIAGFQDDGTPECVQTYATHDGVQYQLTWVGDHPYPYAEKVATISNQGQKNAIRWVTEETVELVPVPSSTASYQERCCKTCWNRYGRAISRLGAAATCDRCGAPWVSCMVEA